MAKFSIPKRSRRRMDTDRMKAKAKRIGQQHNMPGNWRKCYDYLAVCSCHACGNPRRKWDERTVQELRFEVSPA